MICVPWALARRQRAVGAAHEDVGVAAGGGEDGAGERAGHLRAADQDRRFAVVALGSLDELDALELENALGQRGRQRRPVGDSTTHDVDDQEALVEERFEPTHVACGEGGEELIVGLLGGQVIAHGALQCPGSVEPLHPPTPSPNTSLDHSGAPVCSIRRSAEQTEVRALDPAAITQSSRTEVEAVVDRLTADLADAIERQTATSEVLQAIGRSASEAATGLRDGGSPRRPALCRATAGTIYQLDGDVYRSRGRARRVCRVPAATSRSTPSRGVPGRWWAASGSSGAPSRSRTPPRTRSYQWREARELGGYRTMLGVPMLVDDRVVGCDRSVARAGRPVRRPDDRPRDDLRGAGRDRDPERASSSRSSSSAARSWRGRSTNFARSARSARR